MMEIIHQAQTLREKIIQLRKQNKRIALVPTMGNLHAGHLSLVEQVKQKADVVVTSIFVNPTQFGVNEDFDRYPRTLEQDAQLLKQAGNTIVFAPDVKTMYPNGMPPLIEVHAPLLDSLLCGASRPGHFTGVATVVSKLFNLVMPDVAIFGEKDFQQLLVIRRLVSELAFPIEIIGAPIMREANGLAMSSRNQYLTAEQRELAGKIYQQLCASKNWLLVEKNNTAEKIAAHCQQAAEQLNQLGFQTDYYEIRRQSDLQLPQAEDKELVILVAAKLGNTRLIDNLVL